MLHFRPIPFFRRRRPLRPGASTPGSERTRTTAADDYDGDHRRAARPLCGHALPVTGDIVTGEESRRLRPRGEVLPHALHLRPAEAGLEVMAGIGHLHNDFPWEAA